MRRIVLLGLLALLACDARAQRRGGFAHGFGRPAYGLNRGSYARPNGYGYGYGYGDDYGYTPYNTATPYTYSPQPVVFIQPPPIVQPPPRPVHPVVTNYNWPAQNQSALSDAEPQTFAIVLKNGSTLSAISVLPLTTVCTTSTPTSATSASP